MRHEGSGMGWPGFKSKLHLCLCLSSVICKMGEQDGKEELALAAVASLHSRVTQRRGETCVHPESWSLNPSSYQHILWFA